MQPSSSRNAWGGTRAGGTTELVAKRTPTEIWQVWAWHLASLSGACCRGVGCGSPKAVWTPLPMPRMPPRRSPKSNSTSSWPTIAGRPRPALRPRRRPSWRRFSAEAKALAERLTDNEQLRAEFQQKHEEAEAKLAEFLSEKENLQKQAKQVKDELTGKLTAAEKQAKDWEQRYQDSSIKRELLDAASQNDAFSAQQMVNMLKANTKLVAVKDEAGKDTGEYQVMVGLEDVVDDKPVITILSPDAALKRMKQLPMYQNLFKAGVVSGVGGGNADTSTKIPADAKNMTQAQYHELRKKDPQKLYQLFGAK